MPAKSRPHPARSHGRGARWTTAFVLLFAAGTGDAAPAGAPARHARIAPRPPPRPLELASASVSLAAEKAPWAGGLAPVDVKSGNTNARVTLRLYGEDGALDRSALHAFMRVASSTAELAERPDGGGAEPLDTRLVQLAIRAAYHFGGKPIVIVSATRKGSHGKHAIGEALDFRIDGVRAAKLASYLRTFPCAGVGVYTHPKTQYVHLDVRERSFHWLDGSPPGVRWRERRLPDRTQQKRDASYTRVADLPEVPRK